MRGRHTAPAAPRRSGRPFNTRDTLEREIDQQRKWIEQCGGSLEGYVERYGSKDAPEHMGDGGEAIYRADTAHLEKLEAELRAFGPRR